MIKKIKFKLELLWFYFKKNFFFLLVGTILGSLGFATKNQIINFINSPNFQTKKIGIEGLYTINNLPTIVSQQISLGLSTTTDNNKITTSRLVKSLDIQNENKDYIFELDTNQKWHDNTNLTTSDINYQINGATINIINKSLVKISLKSQFSPFLSLLIKPIFKKNLTGLGPYKLTNTTYQDGYIKTLTLKPFNTNKNNLLYRFYTNENDLINAYKLGEVDEIETSHLPVEISTWTNSKVVPAIQTNNYIAIFLNTEKITTKQTRQALAYATPKTNNINERCLGPIPPNSWAYNANIKDYKYNPTRGQELLDKDSLAKISLLVTDRKLLNLADEISKSWQKILGTTTTITIGNQINDKTFDAILAFGGSPIDPDQYLFWHSTQNKSNITHLNNSRIDKLLEEGRQTLDLQERKKIYQDFQKYLLEESPAIFLNYPTIYAISRIK